MKDKSLRILITPNVAVPYDLRMVRGLAKGFNSIGHFAYPSAYPLSSKNLVKQCEALSIDVLVQVNRVRDPNVPLPKNMRHVSWYQDVYLETSNSFSDIFHSSDILYTLGDPNVLGIKDTVPCYMSHLFTGVDPATSKFSLRGTEQNIDFSLCGGLPGPINIVPNYEADILWFLDNLVQSIPFLGKTNVFWILRKLLFSKRLPVNYLPYFIILKMVESTKIYYKPLRGDLDIHALSENILNQLDNCKGALDGKIIQRPYKINKSVANFFKPYAKRTLGRRDLLSRLIRYIANESEYFKETNLTPIQQGLNYFAQSYPRILDRMMLVEMATKISSNLQIYGPGWDGHEFGHPYFKGVLETEDELLSVYLRSKINLSNNNHGLGLHSRTLECMAVGGFIFLHESPHDDKVGGILSEFEPNEHYGSFTPENFQAEAIRWLGDEKKRKEVGRKASLIIHERHCWHHRAQQIINDLNR
tara:strand:+ start:179 stop:1597 length:1419 start_codon:yes stop_codon:yes gene_type:complete